MQSEPQQRATLLTPDDVKIIVIPGKPGSIWTMTEPPFRLTGLAHAQAVALGKAFRAYVAVVDVEADPDEAFRVMKMLAPEIDWSGAVHWRDAKEARPE